jgi:hypothetical protein
MRKFIFITSSKEFWSMWRFVALNISVTNMLEKMKQHLGENDTGSSVGSVLK